MRIHAAGLLSPTTNGRPHPVAHPIAGRKLYLYFNGTGAPPESAVVAVPQLKVLMNASGTQWAPVRNVSLQGLKFTAAAYTYMEPHGVPSAGTGCRGQGAGGGVPGAAFPLPLVY